MTKRLVACLVGTAVLLLFASCGDPDPQVAQAPGGSPPASPVSILCNSVGHVQYPKYDGIEEFAWASHQIVVGSVVAQLPPKWSEPLTTGMEQETGGPARTIITEYVIQVENRLRGKPFSTVRVQTEGGTIDGCTIKNPDTGEFAVGDRVLLFLTRPELPQGAQTNIPDGTYVLLSGRTGHLVVKDDAAVAPVTSTSSSWPFNDVAHQILTALRSGNPPTDMPSPPVPLDLAPVPPIANP